MKTTPKRIYSAVLKRAIKGTFPVWQKLGMHIAPNHFYEPIPDIREIRDELWLENSELPGIDTAEDKQLQLLSIFSKYKKEYDQFPNTGADRPYDYFFDNQSFGSVDGELLYCMVREYKPHSIIEIGSGFSTFIAASAIRENQKQEPGYSAKLTAIDPFPNETIKGGFPGLSGVVEKKVQDVPLNFFKDLKENDILFIDSSHVLKIGSDVQYEFLEILPRLNKGVLIHIHDVFLPAEYPKEWIFDKKFFWTEQYLLQSFMAFNNSFEFLWLAGDMIINHPDKLEEFFKSYNHGTTRPSSCWLRKIR